MHELYGTCSQYNVKDWESTISLYFLQWQCHAHVGSCGGHMMLRTSSDVFILNLRLRFEGVILKEVYFEGQIAFEGYWRLQSWTLLGSLWELHSLMRPPLHYSELEFGAFSLMWEPLNLYMHACSLESTLHTTLNSRVSKFYQTRYP